MKIEASNTVTKTVRETAIAAIDIDVVGVGIDEGDVKLLQSQLAKDARQLQHHAGSIAKASGGRDVAMIFVGERYDRDALRSAANGRVPIVAHVNDSIGVAYDRAVDELLELAAPHAARVSDTVNGLNRDPTPAQMRGWADWKNVGQLLDVERYAADLSTESLAASRDDAQANENRRARDLIDPALLALNADLARSH